MASARDIQDIMGMGGAVQRPANKRKKKVVEAQPKLSGISREVAALMGDSVPPISIVEQPKYKSKPSLASKLYKPRHWEEMPFQHGARSDGLVLKHWKRAIPGVKPQVTNGDVDMADGEKPAPVFQYEEEFPMDKWNVKIRVPEYSEEQYEKYFQTDDWTREETDYLMRLASDYDLRWILIADRYEPDEISPPTQTNGEAIDTQAVKPYPPRTMEQLKLRYYQVAAQDLELKTPKSSMTQPEFQLWEKMRNFDAKTEAMRKAMAEKLFERTKDEAEEERTLLEELHRITKNEEEFIAMRRDLYARLEAAPSLRRNERGEEQNIVLSSAGLSDLLSRLFAKEKHLKRRVAPNGEAAAAATQTPVDQRSRQPSQMPRKDIAETPATENKKSSISQPVVKQLSKADEEKYGVARPQEKLTSGVSFRHEKINRITTAKSQVQTQKLIAALAELEIPNRLSMPTEKVCKEFERLVGQIQLLLDARKTLTRVSEEVKTLEEMKRQRLGLPAEGEANAEAMDVDKKDVRTDAEQARLAEEKGESFGAAEAERRHNDRIDGEPGPAVRDDEDDAEAEDDVAALNVEQTQVEDDEEQDETNVNDESMAQKDDADEEEEEENDEDEDQAEAQQDDDDDDDEEEEEAEEDDDDEGMQALRRGAKNDDEDDEEEQDGDEEAEVEGEDNDDDDAPRTRPRATGANSDSESDEDEEEQDEDEERQDVTMSETMRNAASDDDDEDQQDEEEPSRPTSSGSATRSYKRGASVISDASGAGSNRNGLGRKRKR